jgi:hypothetical protein
MDSIFHLCSLNYNSTSPIGLINLFIQHLLDLYPYSSIHIIYNYILNQIYMQKNNNTNKKNTFIINLRNTPSGYIVENDPFQIKKTTRPTNKSIFFQYH